MRRLATVVVVTAVSGSIGSIGSVGWGQAAAAQTTPNPADLEIYVTTHSVFGLGRHSKIVVTSDRPELCGGCGRGAEIQRIERWYGDRWSPLGCVRPNETPALPRYCWTFAAESSPNQLWSILKGDSELKAEINRPQDLEGEQQDWSASVSPEQEPETTLAARMGSKHQAYIARYDHCPSQRFPYLLVPDGEDGFNSNSFIATLLRELGFASEDYEPPSLTPGFDQLFASWYFQFENGACSVGD